MQNHWLGIHSDKILVDSSTKNTLKLYLKILFGRSAQSAKIFGIFEKNLSLGVRSQWIQATFEKDFNHQALRNPEIAFAMLTGMNWITD